ncbi:MAG: methylmalonyl Co-A mutase-associated GTPase MeaB [Proteobacteria bacterium]|nr:methylmalonyl Co-A mutase-associated GTPase MeaB [Pseudomonadota bacterium]
MGYVPSADLVPKVLEGDLRAIARLVTRAESGVDEARAALDDVFRHAGRAHIVGITGVPGSGKSTLVTALTAAIRRTGRKVAIVAIDPSSPFSGGSILGDRIRMGEIAGDPGVFVRSMATRGALGGLARGALEAVDVLDAAGFDVVIIETVGVGQDEVEVARAAHTTVVVSAPGLGDDIQAIKAGILEVADVHAVSKCDRPDANRTIADLKNMLALSAGPGTRYGVRLASKAGAAPGNDAAWRPPVIATSSVRGEGIDDLLAAVDRHFASLRETGELDARRTHIAERRMLAAGEDILRARFARHRDGRVFTLLDAVRTRRLSPHAAALRLLDELQPGGSE